MNILILSDYYPPDKLGGVGEIAKNLYDQYTNKKHDTWVLTTGPSKSTSRIIRGSNSLIKGVFLNNIKVIRMIKKQNIDIINMHQSTTTLFLLTKHIPFLYKKFPKIVNSFQVSYLSEFKHIRTVRVAGRTFKPARKEYIEKWLYSPMHLLLDFIGYIFADEITVVSSENKKEFERSYGRLWRKNIHIIPNGVNTGDYKPRKTNLKSSFTKKIEGNIVFLYVGVFRARKRVFNLLFSLQEVVSKNKNVSLVLVGGGRDYEQEVRNLARELGIYDHIIFVGRVPNEDVVEYLNASDVFCLVSSYEGMPIAILEAMANSKAIITSRVSGMIDLIEDDVEGYLSEVDDIKDIACNLQKLVSEPKKMRAMGQAARKKVINSYQWSTIADKYIEVFNR